jgi:hypothetical protein
MSSDLNLDLDGTSVKQYKCRMTRKSHPRVAQKRLLKDFWRSFKSSRTQQALEKKGLRIVGQSHPKWQKVAALKQMASESILHPKHSSPEEMRHDWDLLKGMATKRPCFVCFQITTHRHHIIQIQNGGSNEPENIIPICHECHCKVHPWMKINLALVNR